jgi:hypothetical protein
VGLDLFFDVANCLNSTDAEMTKYVTAKISDSKVILSYESMLIVEDGETEPLENNAALVQAREENKTLLIIISSFAFIIIFASVTFVSYRYIHAKHKRMSEIYEMPV